MALFYVRFQPLNSLSKLIQQQQQQKLYFVNLSEQSVGGSIYFFDRFTGDQLFTVYVPDPNLSINCVSYTFLIITNEHCS